VFTIAKNALRDHKRRTNNQPSAELPDVPGPDANQGHLIREEFRRVLAAMSRLNEDDRDILALITSTDMSYRDIGRVLDISQTNVKVRVHRARTRLKQLLDEEDQP
jgi:RNA polymerase sigma-70 factor (ECF subfamily)